MANKFYDFQGRARGIERFFYACITRLIANHKSSHESRFFTDGIGYVDQQITIDGYFEKGLIRHIKEVIKTYNKNDLYIDIGANIGNHIVALGHYFRDVAAYEPHPVLFRVLQANLIANGLSISNTFEFGLGQNDCYATLIQSSSNHGLSKVKEFSTMSSEFFDLSDTDFSIEHTIEIRSALKEIESFGAALRNAFIKIDVEGMEVEILRSLKPVIEVYKPAVAVEWAPAEQPDLGEFIKGLRGYKMFGCFIPQPRNMLARLIKNLFIGRYYVFEEIDFCDLRDLYPLVFLVPQE